MSVEEVPKEFVDSETAIEMEKEDILSKPENIRCVCVSRAEGPDSVAISKYVENVPIWYMFAPERHLNHVPTRSHIC